MGGKIIKMAKKLTSPEDEREKQALLQSIARAVDEMVPEGIAFALFVLDYNDDHLSCIGNAPPEDIIHAVRSWVVKAERELLVRRARRDVN